MQWLERRERLHMVDHRLAVQDQDRPGRVQEVRRDQGCGGGGCPRC